MVDIHSHILHSLDDGARDLDESIAMLALAVKSGTTDIVATPHANTEYTYDPAVIDARIEELRQEIEGPIRIHRGCDFHLMFDNVEAALADPAKYSINGNGYVLIEFSDLAIFKTTETDFERLQRAGMRLIITHPERNPLLRQRMDQLKTWVEMGCYLQVTAGSLFGTFGAKSERFTLDLFRAGLVHFVASDAHDTRTRPPVLDRAYDWVASRYGEEKARELFVVNPAAVLRGDPIPEPSPFREKRWSLSRLFGS